MIMLNIHFINKKDKIRIYEAAINRYEGSIRFRYFPIEGLCMQISDVAGSDIARSTKYLNRMMFHMLIFFPELYINKPNKKEGFSYWFDIYDEGAKKRIEILKEAIELLKSKKTIIRHATISSTSQDNS
jgi:hypothetical protein